MSGSINFAHSMRPETIGDFVGQREALEKTLPHVREGSLPSFLLCGPPGCGKSTLAILLAKKAGLPFSHFSAATNGLPDIRKTKKPVIILDEIHRFSKTQQDYFLPAVEDGSLVLLATTTENPETAIAPALLSRMNTVRLDALSRDDLAKIAVSGIRRQNTRLKKDQPPIPEDGELVDFLCSFSGGDARSLLSLIPLIPELETHSPANLARLLPEKLARHDDESHYTKISALIKSIRKGAPQAAVYWLAALLKSGEDPAFICRRLVISAAEDIGLANPTAVVIAQSCLAAVERTGMPEAGIIMAECALYLAMSPKSGSACSALMRAYEHIGKNGVLPVPGFLRKAHSRDHMRYPVSDYLPYGEGDFYRPETNGREKGLFENWKKTMEEDFG